MPAPRLKIGQIAIFSLPTITSVVMHGPMAGIIPALYTEKFKLNLAVVGAILLITRVFDAVIDPLIGFLSDKTRSPIGGRKPWVIGGTLLTVVALYKMFVPSGSVDDWYFLGWQLALYLAWTMTEIPYVGWMIELSRDSKTRTRIAGARTFAYYVGGLIFSASPLLAPGSHGQMTFEVLRVLSLGVIVVVPLAALAAVIWTPRGEVYAHEASPKFTELWGSVRRNRPLQSYVLMYVFIGCAGGVSATLSFIYLQNFLKIGDKFVEVSVPALLIGPIMLPIWVFVLNFFDKVRACAVIFTLYTCVMPTVFFIDPGPGAFWPFAIYSVALTAFYPLLAVAMPSIMGDIIDYDELKTGKNRAGQYSAFITMIAKGTGAIGGPLAFLLLGLVGYAPSNAINSPVSVLGLKLIYAGLPTLLVIPSLYLLYTFPINDRRHAIIRRRLQSRGERARVKAEALATVAGSALPLGL